MSEERCLFRKVIFNAGHVFEMNEQACKTREREAIVELWRVEAESFLCAL